MPPDEAAAWEDEVEVDLNPLLGPNWMLSGTRQMVMTPGTNVKRPIAATQGASNGS